MPPKKRENIGRLTKGAKRKRKERQNETDEERADRNENMRLRMIQSRATKSSHLSKTRKEVEIEMEHLSQYLTIIDPVPVIKTEIMDPPEIKQEFILPDYPQDMTYIDPMWVVETEIQDSYTTNKFLLPNIKIEPIEIESDLYKSSRTERLPESFINGEIENSLIFKYKLTGCSVLLHDCLIPENLASISAKFKSVRINTDISKTFHKVNLFPLSDTLFLPHISEAYKNMAFHEKEKGKNEKCKKEKGKKGKNKKVKSQMMSVSKKSKPSPEVKPNKRKRKEKSHFNWSKKHSCNCLKAAEDSMINMGNQENDSESAQQLCLCLTSDNMLLEPTDMLLKEVSLFDPNFGKIMYGINR